MGTIIGFLIIILSSLLFLFSMSIIIGFLTYYLFRCWGSTQIVSKVLGYIFGIMVFLISVIIAFLNLYRPCLLILLSLL